MRRIAGSENARKLVEAIQNPDEMPEAPSVELLVGERAETVDLGDERVSMLVQSADSGALVLDAEVADIRPRESVNAPVVATLRMNGGSLRVFAGRAKRPSFTRTSTGLIASSAGAWRDKIVLNEAITYEGQPERLLRRVLQKVVYYDRTKIAISEIGGYIKRGVDSSGQPAQDTGFLPENKVSEVCARVQEETQCVFRDTPESGVDVLPEPGLSGSGEAAWSYEALEGEGWVTQVPDDALYSSVVVEKKPEPPPEEGVPGKPGWRRTAPVNHSRLASPPPPGSVYWMVVTDDDAARGPKNGQHLANQLAFKFGREVFGFTLTRFLNPLLELYDFVTVGQDLPGYRYKQSGTWRYEWACSIRGFKHDFGRLSSEFAGEATIRREEFTADPPIPVRAGTEQVVDMRAIREMFFGEDVFGLFHTTTAVPWQGEDEFGYWIDPDLAGQTAGQDGFGRWREI